MFSETMNLDAHQGLPLSRRSWDHQLRQPMLLATGNSVLPRAHSKGSCTT